MEITTDVVQFKLILICCTNEVCKKEMELHKSHTAIKHNNKLDIAPFTKTAC